MASKAQGELTRQRLLDAATESFAEHGFRGTSLDAVATTAGVTRHALLHYYRSKDELLLAVLERRDEEDRRVADEVREGPERDLAERLLVLIERYEESPTLARLAAASIGESVIPGHPAHEYYRQRYERVRTRWTEEIRAEQARGRISSSRDAESLAIAILGLLNGLNVQRLLDPTVDTRSAARAVLDAVLSGDDPAA